MTYRAAHGNGEAALARTETAPVDELPIGVPERDPPAFDAHGKFAKGNVLARKGAIARSHAGRLALHVALTELPDGVAFKPYRQSAVTFRKVHCRELARTVGGGVCGPGPSSIVASAALALAWSRYLSDKAAATDDPDLAVRAIKMASDSRQMLLTAHELCAREAMARQANQGPETHEQRAARLLGTGEKR